MGTTLIKAKITDQTLEFTLKPMVASGGINEDVIEFEFDELWDGFNTVAVFYRSKREVFHIKIVGNRCTIPSEVLRTQGVCYVGVMGVKDNVTRTTNVLRYEIEHGAITAGVEPPEPTPSIYEQILETVKSTKQIAQSVRDDADAGMFDGAPGPKGDPGSDASVTADNIQSALGYKPVKDVQVAGASVLVDGVANVPMADIAIPGVIKTGNANESGIVFEDGVPKISFATDDQISSRNGQRKSIVCTNLDYAVKTAMCDGKGAAWNRDEKNAAQRRAGINELYELIEEFDLSEASTFERSEEPDGTPYAFVDIITQIIVPANVSPPAGSCFIFAKNIAGKNIIISSGNMSAISLTKIRAGFIHRAYIHNGYWESAWSDWITNISVLTFRWTDVYGYWLKYKESEYKAVNKIRVTAALPAGTHIRIFGVRA